MKIALVRHGKPDIALDLRVKAYELSHWLKAYDDVNLDPTHPPPEASVQIAQQCRVAICSDLKRSQQSAKMLGVEPIESDTIFRELELPYFTGYSPKFSLSTWAMALRLAWLAGFSRNSESLRDGKKRASAAAEKLIALANTHQSLIFVGHGMINHFIGKELRRQEWDGPKNAGRRYWEFGVYTKT